MQILIMVRACRERNFDVYVASLEKITPFFFSLDHQNYSRWLPIHIFDLKNLPKSVESEFKSGKFVVTKTSRIFSSIPLDQAHEQLNKDVKTSGGIIGITQNPKTLSKWMTSGPELIKATSSFEDNFINVKTNVFSHHSQTESVQCKFKSDTKKLEDYLTKNGNPIMDDSQELVSLESRDCVGINNLRKLEEVGQRAYNDFVQHVIINKDVSIHKPLKRFNLKIFKSQKREKNSHIVKLKCVQEDADIFGKFYIAMQERKCDMGEFFSHEMRSYPPSISDQKELHLPTGKSDLLACLPDEQILDSSDIDVYIIDGPALVHSRPVQTVETFNDFAEKLIIPYIQNILKSAHRVDMVFDRYMENSLKASTRAKRGTGCRRKVSGSAKIPMKWKQFLANSINKTELFMFLSEKISQMVVPHGKSVYVTAEEKVFSVCNGTEMGICSHEEADTRMLVHMRHAIECGHRKFRFVTVDTDVVVIIISNFHLLSNIADSPLNVSVAFGFGNNLKYFNIHRMCLGLGKDVSRALIAFHSFTGADCTSSFRYHRKKMCWKTWLAYSDATEAFLYIAQNPFAKLSENHNIFKLLEKFTVLLYNSKAKEDSVNECRQMLFAKKTRSTDKIPPTKNALFHHMERAQYQCGIWSTATDAQPSIPSPGEFSWEKSKDGSWTPTWMSVEPVSKACSQLIRCNCKDRCTKCVCKKKDFKCTLMCKCKCLHPTGPRAGSGPCSSDVDRQLPLTQSE